MSEMRAPCRCRGGRVSPKPKYLRCGLNHYLWAHGYLVRRRGGLFLIERAKNSSAASRAERAIYQELSAKMEAKSEQDVR